MSASTILVRDGSRKRCVASVGAVSASVDGWDERRALAELRNKLHMMLYEVEMAEKRLENEEKEVKQ